MRFVVVNSFSINMLPREGRDLCFRPISPEAARNLIVNERAVSAIGHVDTAVIVARLVGLPERAAEWKEISATRPTITMNGDTSLIVAQYTGPRLPEGATTLPEGAKIEFWSVYHV